tara:strand:+ start:819 stop:1205 length:387 start_codon:yes stop_codon:yes gene_type:complete
MENTYHDVLKYHFSHCQFAMDGNEYSGLKWLDSKVEKPTESEMNTLLSNLDNLIGTPLMRELRRHRNARLQECDWTQGVDSPLSDSKKAEWQTYRQALRDITKTHVPSVVVGTTLLDIDVVPWPTKPN